MVAYDPYNIATTLRFDRANRHLSVDFLQQASLILYKLDDIKNIDDTILVSEFGSKLFILVCTWRLLRYAIMVDSPRKSRIQSICCGGYTWYATIREQKHLLEM